MTSPAAFGFNLGEWPANAGRPHSLLKRRVFSVESPFVMTIQVLGRGACEYQPGLKLLVSFWPASEFADDEWDAYIVEILRFSQNVPGFRVLSWNRGNATPRPEQQKRMGAAMGASTHKVAVVTRDPPNGFASSVLAFVNPNIRTFSEAQWTEIWAHLGLSSPEQFKVERALSHLRERVERGVL